MYCIIEDSNWIVLDTLSTKAAIKGVLLKIYNSIYVYIYIYIYIYILYINIYIIYIIYI